jgi:hypothetical protein
MKSGKSWFRSPKTPEGSPQCTIQFSSKALWKQLASGNVELDTSIQDGGIVIHGPAPIMTTLVASVRESLPYRLVPMGTDDRISPTTKDPLPVVPMEAQGTTHMKPKAHNRTQFDFRMDTRCTIGTKSLDQICSIMKSAGIHQPLWILPSNLPPEDRQEIAWVDIWENRVSDLGNPGAGSILGEQG